MIGNIYTVVGFANVLACLLLICCNIEINNKDEYKSKRFIRMLIVFGLFSLFDGFWGMFNTHKLNCGVAGYWINSFIFHFMATHASYTWFVVMSETFDFNSKSFVKDLEMIPAIGGLGVLIAQIFTNCIFSIDEGLIYHTGPLRKVLFYVQAFYFIYGMIKFLFFALVKKTSSDWKHTVVVTEFLFIPFCACMLQYSYPDAPYYSIGFLLGEIAVFDGTIVIERNKQTEDDTIHYQQVSTETYNALKALARGFVSVHLFDLKYNKQHVVKSTPQIDSFVKEEDDARTQIMKVMEGVTDPKYTKDTVAFVDTNTLSERMKGKPFLHHEFLGKNQGWCVSTFIKVEEDEEGNLTKVIHAVQNIDEFKRKEIEYTEALTRAYKNKNAIYAELIRMQSVGLVATDENENIILANDMAMNMFGHKGEEPVGMPFRDFWENAVLENPEQATAEYTEVLLEGGSFSYEINIVNPTTGEVDKYLKASVNTIDLLDGTQVMITCYSDISDNKKIEENLLVLSETDALTEINNRGSGEAKTQALLDKNEVGLFCLIDCDKFKSINDTYGHQVGDEVLIKLAEALKSSFRSEDIVMRLGGDEFAIYAKSVVTKAMAQVKINRLFETIAEIRIPEMPDEIISVSLGAVIVKKQNGVIKDDFSSIYKKADSVMYESKEKIGCCMTFYKEPKL